MNQKTPPRTINDNSLHKTAVHSKIHKFTVTIHSTHIHSERCGIVIIITDGQNTNLKSQDYIVLGLTRKEIIHQQCIALSNIAKTDISSYSVNCSGMLRALSSIPFIIGHLNSCNPICEKCVNFHICGYEDKK